VTITHRIGSNSLAQCPRSSSGRSSFRCISLPVRSHERRRVHAWSVVRVRFDLAQSPVSHPCSHHTRGCHADCVSSCPHVWSSLLTWCRGVGNRGRLAASERWLETVLYQHAGQRTHSSQERRRHPIRSQLLSRELHSKLRQVMCGSVSCTRRGKKRTRKIAESTPQGDNECTIECAIARVDMGAGIRDGRVIVASIVACVETLQRMGSGSIAAAAS
jgi:hypothetical protein